MNINLGKNCLLESNCLFTHCKTGTEIYDHYGPHSNVELSYSSTKQAIYNYRSVKTKLICSVFCVQVYVP